jgi:hypothetical protein
MNPLVSEMHAECRYCQENKESLVGPVPWTEMLRQLLFYCIIFGVVLALCNWLLLNIPQKRWAFGQFTLLWLTLFFFGWSLILCLPDKYYVFCDVGGSLHCHSWSRRPRYMKNTGRWEFPTLQTKGKDPEVIAISISWQPVAGSIFKIYVGSILRWRCRIVRGEYRRWHRLTRLHIDENGLWLGLLSRNFLGYDISNPVVTTGAFGSQSIKKLLQVDERVYDIGCYLWDLESVSEKLDRLIRDMLEVVCDIEESKNVARSPHAKRIKGKIQEALDDPKIKERVAKIKADLPGQEVAVITD